MPKIYRQQKFGFMKLDLLEFGGELGVGRRKTVRPISPRAVLHLVLKSEDRKLFNPRDLCVEMRIREVARRFRVKILDFALNWNHSHLAIKVTCKKDYIGFIRVLTSKLSLMRSNSAVLGMSKKLFPRLPYTRIVSFGRDLMNLLSYIQKNREEACGKFTRKEESSAKEFRRKPKASRNKETRRTPAASRNKHSSSSAEAPAPAQAPSFKPRPSPASPGESG